MRTTLTLDDRIDHALRVLAAKHRVSYREMVNRTLRLGLATQQEAGQALPRFVVRPHRGGFRPAVDPEKLNQVVDDLEVEDFMAESRG